MEKNNFNNTTEQLVFMKFLRKVLSTEFDYGPNGIYTEPYNLDKSVEIAFSFLNSINMLNQIDINNITFTCFYRF